MKIQRNLSACLLAIFFFIGSVLFAQADLNERESEHLITAFQKFKDRLSVQNSKLISKMRKAENKLRSGGKQQKADTGSYKSPSFYDSLSAGKLDLVRTRPGTTMDSLMTGLKFLRTQPVPSIGVPTVSLSMLENRLQELKTELDYTTTLNSLLNKRANELGMARIKKLLAVYRLKQLEITEMINSPEKVQQKLLSILRETPAFRTFMLNNSFLASLFNAPIVSPASDIAGLQSRSQILNELNAITGNLSSSQGTNPLQQQIQSIHPQMDKFRDKINKLTGGSQELNMPEGIVINPQRSKSFFQRLEFGFNIQSQSGNWLLPSITDIAATVGYKVNNKSTVGLGSSYKLGWGQPFNDIRLSSEGMSLRSFIDFKLKGSIWISGGYELNYLQKINKIEELHNLNAWQQSGLIGLTKKYRIKNKQSQMQLLWDFLSYNQKPRAQAIKFRIGYTL